MGSLERPGFGMDLQRQGHPVTANPATSEPSILGAVGAARWLREHGHAHITKEAVWQALSRARKARADGADDPRWFPEPDAPVDARTPGWSAATLAGWKPVGRGAGGGRPSRKEH
jgi:hypothetical protein